MKLDDRARRTLLMAARWSIERGLGKRAAEFSNRNPDPALLEPRASFVTLARHGRLRGCMGTLDIEQPLLDDVVHNARAAALHDPRFAPLETLELRHLQITISVLSVPQPLAAAGRAELLQVLRPHQDGVIVVDHAHRTTFLPEVWQTLPEPQAFLDALLQKAGFEAGYWSPSLHFLRYQADSFQEEGAT